MPDNLALDGLPLRLTRSGLPVFEVHPRSDLMNPHPALMAIDPPWWIDVDDVGVCAAIGAANFRPDPLTYETMADFEAQPSCRRVALHDGPHAYFDLDGQLITFTECFCVPVLRDSDQCFHTADAVQAGLVDPELTIWVADQAGPADA